MVKGIRAFSVSLVMCVQCSMSIGETQLAGIIASSSATLQKLAARPLMYTYQGYRKDYCEGRLYMVKTTTGTFASWGRKYFHERMDKTSETLSHYVTVYDGTETKIFEGRLTDAKKNLWWKLGDVKKGRVRFSMPFMYEAVFPTDWIGSEKNTTFTLIDDILLVENGHRTYALSNSDKRILKAVSNPSVNEKTENSYMGEWRSRAKISLPTETYHYRGDRYGDPLMKTTTTLEWSEPTEAEFSKLMEWAFPAGTKMGGTFGSTMLQAQNIEEK